MTRVLPKDDNNHVIQRTYPFATKKSITFDGEAGTGEIGIIDLFEITGVVSAQLLLVCTDDLVGDNAVILQGVTSDTSWFNNNLIATNVDTDEIFIAASGDNPKSWTAGTTYLIKDTNVVIEITIANITGGSLDIYLLWQPISEDGNVEVA